MKPLNPLPTRSSMYTHKNCIKRTNIAMQNVAKKGPTYDFKVNL